uniref:NADH-ubiquinone oxidoreductase chain 5 n=1 Tax=Acavomonas peruviana TaxID=1542312 RepID=V5KWK8_9ALVE|nr:NADH dehydrogenase subunit 5a [Acavomonas peruviana]AHA41673.1 NADH dehydrogenase subunit 5a [Acavomonas peruviana]
MLLTCIFSIFITFIVLFFFGFAIGFKGSSFIARIVFLFSFLYIISLVFSSFYSLNSIEYIQLFSFFDFFDLKVEWGFEITEFSIMMSFVVITIGTAVCFFSDDYMKEDPKFSKFIAYVSLFIFFMEFVVLSSNYILFFIGWEGVGVCSMLLINFWNTRSEAVKSSIKAFFINRIGDYGLFLCWLLMFVFFGHHYIVI